MWGSEKVQVSRLGENSSLKLVLNLNVVTYIQKNTIKEDKTLWWKCPFAKIWLVQEKYWGWLLCKLYLNLKYVAINLLVICFYYNEQWFILIILLYQE